MRRRNFLYSLLSAFLAPRTWAQTSIPSGSNVQIGTRPQLASQGSGEADVKLFLCGDVMMGRGVDQILPHPANARLYEPYVRSALDYVEMAEQRNGKINRPVDFSYPWGDALAELERMRPVARIINLETAITASENAWPDKGINYRMNPANVACLTAAGIDCCVLSNNHVLDWGYAGLKETLVALHAQKLQTAGAGQNKKEAAAPAIIELPGSTRLLIFALGTGSAGVPPDWAATGSQGGVNYLIDLSPQTANGLAKQVHAFRKDGDVVVVSIHWGSNWGYEIPGDQRAFAHRLIDSGSADLVHGHSSHHPRPTEIYREKAILYGCGDFLNDYEGIEGYESFRPDLTLMYFPTLDWRTAELTGLSLVPMQIRKFRLNRAPKSSVQWMEKTLDRESRQFGTRVIRQSDDTLALQWH